MATNVAGARGWGAHRIDPVPVEKTVSFNTSGIGAGVFWFRIPARAQITSCLVNVETAFNAGTTNVLTIGYGASLNEIVAAGDVDESSATAQSVTTGNSLEFSEEKDVYVKYAQTGTAATAGKARIVLSYTVGEGI